MTTPANSAIERPAVKITEAFTERRPAFDYSAITRRLLATVPDKYIVGLDSVVICDLADQPRKIRTGTLPRRGRKVRREQVSGLYHRAWGGQKAWIQIFADQISMPPRYVRWIRPLSDLSFGQVLYHELGHHVHTIRPEYREKEDVADDWSGRFAVRHLRRAYWYLYPVLWGAAKVMQAYLRLKSHVLPDSE